MKPITSGWPARSRCTLALGLLFAAAPALAADVVGTVMRDGKPLPGVNVVFLADGNTYNATTDGHGRFLLRNIRPGTYRMECGSAATEVLVRDGLNQVNCNG